MSSFTSPEGMAMLLIAGLCDAVSITAAFIIGIIPCLILDFFCLMIIGSWMSSRSKGIEGAAERETDTESEITMPDRTISSTESIAERKQSGKQEGEQAGKQKEKQSGKQEGKQKEKQSGKQEGKQKEKQGGKQAGKQAEKQTGKQMEKMAAKKTSKKIALRAGGAFLGTLVPIVQLIPFWTITVVQELKE